MTLYYTENIAIPFSGVKRYFNLRQLCGVVKYPEVNSVYSVSLVAMALAMSDG